jgi:protein-S-isoprenylcysteine O-methyltransferase Ste14
VRSIFIRQLISIILLPGLVTLVIPALIQWQNPPLHTGWRLSPPWNALPILAGVLLLSVGLVLLIQTISLFIARGRGTIAPWDPAQQLVVRGPYRNVRNPMISGVLAILLAEALLLGSIPLLIYFIIVSVLNALYIPLSEEPGLEKRFGQLYITYKKHVPRWIPRLKPWEGGENEM